MTVIAGRLELLARRNPPAQDALVATQRLDRMMADLICAARMEAGSLTVAQDSLDLVDVVGATLEGLALPVGIDLSRQIPADLPFVTGDPVLLHHVLLNLIDNAFRHARAEVVVSARAQDGRVLLNVDDDGQGVPEGDRERIFERFSRLEGSDRADGSGLGLAIVKGFAEAMAMPVNVTNRPAGGARFTVSLPLAPEMSA